MIGRLARGVLALSLLMAGAAGAQSVTLDVESMRDLAFQAVQANRPGEALVIADALLARDPQDAAALILKAQALRAIGQLPAAEAAARAGFAAATTPELHYGAALVLAQILSLQEQRNFAQLWLRRASYYATTDEQRARVATDYGYVRKQNPLNLQFTLSLQPSNNVNNGAMRSIWDYYGIPLQLSGDAQALSGLVGSAGVSATYRLAQTQSSFDALTFDASQQLVFLSAAARDQAPNVTNSDYALTSLTGGWQHRDLLATNGTILTSEFSLGHSWYGLDDLSNTGLATFDLTKPLTPDLQGFGHLGLKRNQRLDDPGSSSNVIDLAGGTSKRLGNGDTLRLTFGLTQTQSADIEVDNTSYSARIDWTHAKPIQGILWSAGVEAEQTDYALSPYAFDGRHDLRLTATLSAEFTKISTYGFSPVVTLNLSSNDSSIGLYDTQTTGIGLSFRSRF